MLDRDVALLRHPGFQDDVGGAMLGDPEEEVKGILAPVLQHGQLPILVEVVDPSARDELNISLGKCGEERLGGCRRRRDGARERHQEGDLALLASSASREIVVEEKGGLAGGRRALEWRPADADHGAPGLELLEQLPHPPRSGHRVELVAGLGEARRRAHVVVGAECHDEDVGLVLAGVRRHTSVLRIDRRDRLIGEANTGLDEIAVRKPDGVGCLPPEHDVQLRVAEDEGVSLLDQDHVGVFAELLREDRRQLETAEPRPEHDYPGRHVRPLSLPVRAARPCSRRGP